MDDECPERRIVFIDKRIVVLCQAIADQGSALGENPSWSIELAARLDEFSKCLSVEKMRLENK